MKDSQIYQYRWGGDKTEVGRFRQQFKGRKCVVIARGSMNGCLVRFTDNDEMLNCSRNALRKAR